MSNALMGQPKVVRVRNAADLGLKDLARPEMYEGAVLTERLLVRVPKEISDEVVSVLNRGFTKWEKTGVDFRLVPQSEPVATSHPDSDIFDFFVSKPAPLSKAARAKPGHLLDYVVAETFLPFGGNVELEVEKGSQIPMILGAHKRPNVYYAPHPKKE